MTDEPHSQLHQELRAHASALRGLARDLLRDSHAAEDVTQQTLAKAWAARDQLQPGPMGGWLQRVLTNFTKQWRRGERRRAARESLHGGERAKHHQASPAETLARREALQSVTNAVLQLDEPFQTAVFLRYFEDLPPRVIAARTDCNVATVKSRIARGLVMLRLHLSQSQGEHDWRLGLACTLGLPFSSLLSPLTTGVLLMKAAIKITAAAAVLCIGGVYLYRGTDPQPPASTPEVTKDAGTIAASSAPVDQATPAIDRTQADRSDTDSSLLHHPYGLELTVHVVDEYGLPVAGYTPQLAPPGGSLQSAEQATDDTGTVIVRWAAREPMVQMDVLDPRRHRRHVTVRHGQPTHITLIDRKTQGTVLFARGNKDQFWASGSATDKSQRGLHPHAVFTEKGLVPVTTSSAATSEESMILQDIGVLALRAGSFRVMNIGLENVGWNVDTSTLPKQAVQPTGCSIEGTVYGEDGKPQADIPVALLGSGAKPLHRTKTNEQGTYRFKQLLANQYTVRAGGTDQGLACVEVRADEGNYSVPVHLTRDACIRGSLRNEAGEPIAEATIEWLSSDGKWADRTITSADGSFLLANLPSTTGDLYAWHKDGAWRFPIAKMAGAIPDTGTFALTGAIASSGSLQVKPSATPECNLEDLRLRVRHMDTGFSCGISAPRVTTSTLDAEGNEQRAMMTPAGATWQLEHLTPGFYELEMWLPGYGKKSLGRYWVDGKGVTDLGTASFAPPGLLHFDTPASKMPPDLAFEICELRAPFDVRIEQLSNLTQEIRLAAGNYVLVTRRGEAPPHFQSFQVKREQTTSLKIDW